MDRVAVTADLDRGQDPGREEDDGGGDEEQDRRAVGPPPGAPAAARQAEEAGQREGEAVAEEIGRLQAE